MVWCSVSCAAGDSHIAIGCRYKYHSDQTIEELADLLEVIYAAAMARGYTLEQLESVRAAKAEKRGAFANKILLKEVIEK